MSSFIHDFSYKNIDSRVILTGLLGLMILIGIGDSGIVLTGFHESPDNSNRIWQPGNCVDLMIC